MVNGDRNAISGRDVRERVYNRRTRVIKRIGTCLRPTATRYRDTDMIIQPNISYTKRVRTYLRGCNMYIIVSLWRVLKRIRVPNEFIYLYTRVLDYVRCTTCDCVGTCLIHARRYNIR